MAKGKSKQADKRRMKEDADLFEMSKESKENVVSKLEIKPGIKFKTKKQEELYNTIMANEITIISGCAGTGKTFIVLKAALEQIIEKQCKKIVITKPIIEATENLGFLPGDLSEKISPYLNSYMGNFAKLVKSNKSIEAMVEKKIIEFYPLSFMRGDTFTDNSICVLDEAQNTTVNGMKLFVTRKPESAKLIIMGDIDQTDLKLKNGEKSGLEDAMNRFKGIEGIGFVEFTEDDIVRSKILIDIMKSYKKPKEEENTFITPRSYNKRQLNS